MVISQTPVRISISGGGTDFPDFYEKHGSIIISTAINKYIYVIIKPRFDKDITVNYRSVAQHVKSIDEIEHDFIRETAKMTGMTNGFDIITLSDVPTEGSGLGSSSALIVGLINAMFAYKGNNISQDKLAELACKLEIDILKKPIGIQDQFIAAYGGFKAFRFSKNLPDILNLTKLIHPSLLTQIENNLFLHYIPYNRDSYSILTEQKNNIENTISQLKEIYNISVKLLESFINDNIELQEISNTISESWKIKKQLSTNISNDLIENMIFNAKNAGATACKVVGAGGGGFLLSYVPESNHRSFYTWMKKYYELPFKFEEHGSRIILNN